MDGRCGVGGVEDDDAVAMFPQAEVIVEARLRGWTAGDWSGVNEERKGVGAIYRRAQESEEKSLS